MDKLLESRTDETAEPRSAIFGLRFLEDEAAEIHDVVGCLISVRDPDTRLSFTGCDDYD